MPYVSKQQFEEGVQNLPNANARTLEQLEKYSTSENSGLRMEFFFYTDEQNKASNLAIDLSKLGYRIDTVDRSEGDEGLWVVTGLTTKMKSDLNTMNDWTTLMWKIGFENDCEFDGWGTLVDQDEMDLR